MESASSRRVAALNNEQLTIINEQLSITTFPAEDYREKTLLDAEKSKGRGKER